MKRLRIGSALAGMAMCAVACVRCGRMRATPVPFWRRRTIPPSSPISSSILPCEITQRHRRREYRGGAGRRRCRSRQQLCRTRAGTKDIALRDDLSRRVSDAVTEENSTSHFAKRFATGLVTGNADDVASLSGTVAGDLFVFGDIRDVVREGKHLAMGEDTDRLVLGLAAAGLAVTAATYVSVGGAAPVRAGLTLVKDARKVGRLGEGLTEWAGRSAREMVDTPMLQNAVASGSVLRPGADHDARSRPRSAPRRPARWSGSPRMSDASARRPASAPRRTR